MTHESLTVLNGWRIAGWGSLLSLLLIPAFAMQVTSEVNWTGSDFVFAAMLLIFLGGAMEFALHGARSAPARLGLALAVATSFFTLWSNAAVGIIGAEDEPLNVGFFFLIIAGIAGAALLRFRPAGLQKVTAVLAVSQLVMGTIATQVMPGHGFEWGILAVFAALWSAASWLFLKAARQAG